MRVAIVGAGQAGLSISHHLRQAGVEHTLLERRRVAQTWRDRWESFCLVTPNWTVRPPGGAYDGADRDGFMPRDEIVSHFERWAERIKAPVQEGVDVRSITPGEGGGFTLDTSTGELRARELVLATGGFQRPHMPRRDLFPETVAVIDTYRYRSPGALAPGGVLVIGSGQTGCQLAEELFESGREVHLACGRAPWLPRRVEGRDIIAWIDETPFLDQPVHALPSPVARLGANPQGTGHGGGHDLNFRTLQAMGVHLHGRLAGVEDGAVHFEDDLAASVEFGDARYADIRALVAKTCAERGVRAPEFPLPEPFVAGPPAALPLDRIGTLIYTAGFRPDYAWTGMPHAFDEMGFPLQVDGTSTVVPGLHFMGVHFQRVRGSSTLMGVAGDAEVLAAALR